MSKFSRVLNAIEAARKQAQAAQREQEKINKELVRRWQQLTRQRVASYERGWA